MEHGKCEMIFSKRIPRECYTSENAILNGKTDWNKTVRAIKSRQQKKKKKKLGELIIMLYIKGSYV